jgi:hypothetical protein
MNGLMVFLGLHVIREVKSENYDKDRIIHSLLR